MNDDVYSEERLAKAEAQLRWQLRTRRIGWAALAVVAVVAPVIAVCAVVWGWPLLLIPAGVLLVAAVPLTRLIGDLGLDIDVSRDRVAKLHDR